MTLITRQYPKHARARVVGVGVETPPADSARFKRKYRLERPYLFYVGRLETGKGIPELVRHHAAWRDRDASAPDLVLAGHASYDIDPRHVKLVGRIPDPDKFDAIAGATAVVIPSRYESLSLLALESFAQGTPVLGNGESEVLKGQVERSGAGATYTDATSFVAAARRIISQRAQLGASGRKFAAQHTWSSVLGIYRDEMEQIARGDA